MHFPRAGIPKRIRNRKLPLEIPYGFIDTDGVGVDYPYLNDAHYPFLNTIFRITPEGYNIPSDYNQIGKVPINISTIPEPTVDECE